MTDKESSVNELTDRTGRPAPVGATPPTFRRERLVRNERSSQRNLQCRSHLWRPQPLGRRPRQPPPPQGVASRGQRDLRPHSHDAADSIDNALESSAAGIRAVKISLLVLGITAIAQIAVVTISGSIALAADTIHNFSDALTAVPLWIAFALSTKAATRRYTYGFGRVEDLAGLFVVAMITMSAIIAGYEAVVRLIHPQPVENVGWVALAGLIGFIGNEWVALYRIGVGRRIGSAALVADGLHARTDGFTSLAVLVAAGAVALGVPLADPIIGLVITVAILAVLRTAVRDVFHRLLDSVDPALIDTAEAVLATRPGVRSVRSLRMRWIGHRLHADAELDIDATLSLADAHRIAHDAEHGLIHAVPKLTTALIHAYPADHPNAAEQHRHGSEPPTEMSSF
ncbi:cation diffusion facilitator transporter family protein [Mycobacterium kansasii]|uniref:Cation diffusion facilitator transporter family protein n=1 Tax=Mycobacterium kansasii TaxID=1768 RepID=A0A1V3WX51_MYCKA|nr:cation diffusion facilitator transporter family protein [Mycobacterium kansasii]